MEREIDKLCEDVAKNRYRSTALINLGVSEVSLRGGMPPVGAQAYGATCTAHAVAAMVAYFENPKNPPRLSPQFLFDMVKRNEDAWLAKNLDSIRNGLEPDAEFMQVYKSQYDRLDLVVRANGGHRTAVARSFIAQFEEQLRGSAGVSSGSMLHRCFDVVRDTGVCREDLRPSASIQRGSLAAKTGILTMPRGLIDDARNHRIVRGLHIFEHPNNVNEIRAVLAGSRNLRPMPVCVAVDIFDGCSNGAFAFPGTDDCGKIANCYAGLHELLIVGFEDNPDRPGGGTFTVRNSWGPEWGDGGYGKMPYAYLEVFCREAGTVLAYDGPRGTSEQHGAGHTAFSGGVCSVCGKRYHALSSLKYVCEAGGCSERICFTCWGSGKKLCQKHSSAVPNTR